jgi:transposase-like protein
MGSVQSVVAAEGVEVSAKAVRRRYTKEYKRRVLAAAEACKRTGELGALLRREGLYSSHLAAWRRARENGELAGAGTCKRGRRAKPVDARDLKIAELERENRRLRSRAERAEALVEVQKKLSTLLGLERPSDETR